MGCFSPRNAFLVNQSGVSTRCKTAAARIQPRQPPLSRKTWRQAILELREVPGFRSGAKNTEARTFVTNETAHGMLL